ncbi:uncharacterized protein LOC135837548 [Planococcus citri]|uniref:uncharacterized protein LOC135837548 n=1 Tax=Planococcus citri TaxID=170843 RepID=UPI0031F9E070
MVDRTTATVRDWLADLSSLQDEEDNEAVTAALYSYVDDKDVITALYSYLDSISNENLEDSKINDVCRVLFEYYRREPIKPNELEEQKESDEQSDLDEQRDPELKCFALQFLPQILYIYLNAIAHSDIETIRNRLANRSTPDANKSTAICGIEAFITGVYNLEIVDVRGQPKVPSFRLPSLDQPSIYHEAVWNPRIVIDPAPSTKSTPKKLKPKSSADPVPPTKPSPKKTKPKSSTEKAPSTKSSPKKMKSKSSTDLAPSMKSSADKSNSKLNTSTDPAQLTRSATAELVNPESWTYSVPLATESSPEKWKSRDSQFVEYGPFQCVHKLVAQERLSVLSRLLFSYYKHISFISKSSPETLQKICKISLKIVTQGFSKPGPRIKVSSSFLSELLNSLRFAMFNGFKYEAFQAIEAIEVRATFEVLSDIILETKACKSYLDKSQTDSGLMGIDVPVTSIIPATTVTAISKSMITNASFRPEKLPDDIPIQDPQLAENANGLDSVSDEKEKNSNMLEVPVKKSLPKIAASLGKKTKERIAIVVRSGSVSSIKGLTKNNSIPPCGGDRDASETDESGIEIGDSGSDGSSLTMQENQNSALLALKGKIRRLSIHQALTKADQCK